MKLIQTFEGFLNEAMIYENHRFGISYDGNASKYGPANYATRPQRPKKIVPFGQDNKELKRAYGLDAKSANLMTKYFNEGIKVIYDFVNREDFAKYRNTGERDHDGSTNFEDLAFIFYSLTSHLGGYSQDALRYSDFVYIGIKGNLNDYEIINHKWSSKFAGGATESFPENRPQLGLRRKIDSRQVRREIEKNVPGSDTFLEKMYWWFD